MGETRTWESPDHKENDNTMRKYLLLISLGVVFAAPKPQELADSSEVELIPPFDSGDGDEGSNPVVIVVRPTSFGDVFAGFPPPPTTVAFSARSSKHSREASEFSMMGKEISGQLFMEMAPRMAIMTTTTSPTARRFFLMDPF